MKQIDKMLAIAKHEVLWEAERKNHEELENAIGRMTTDQLRELVYDDPSDERLKEIFASVGGLHLLESG